MTPTSHEEIMEEVLKQLTRIMHSEAREISWIEAESPHVSEYPINELAINAGFQSTAEMLGKEFSEYIKFVGDNVVKAKKKLYDTPELQHVISLQQRTPKKSAAKRGRGRGRGGKLRGTARGGHHFTSAADMMVPLGHYPKRGRDRGGAGRGRGSVIRDKAFSDHSIIAKEDTATIPEHRYTKRGHGSTSRSSGSGNPSRDVSGWYQESARDYNFNTLEDLTPLLRKCEKNANSPDLLVFAEKENKEDKEQEIAGVSKTPTLSTFEDAEKKHDKERPRIIKTSLMLSNINKHLSSIKISK